MIPRWFYYMHACWRECEQMDLWVYVERKEEGAELRDIEPVNLLIKKGRLRQFGRVGLEDDTEWTDRCTV